MATSFFYIYKLTERPVVLLNVIFKLMVESFKIPPHPLWQSATLADHSSTTSPFDTLCKFSPAFIKFSPH